MRGKIKDITGNRYNKLTVIEYAGRSKTGRTLWKCKCDCGNEVIVQGNNLQSGNTKSCGCARQKHAMKTISNGKQVPEYVAWRHILDRCNNPSNPGYHRYGGRGIKCMFNSFDDFIKEVGPRPSPHHSIDRINNDGNYEHGNVRWATREEQANNKGTNFYIEFKGIKKTIKQWSDYAGINHETLRNRIIDGWPIYMALTAEPGSIRLRKKPVRSNRHLAFVRSHKCCICGSDKNIHAHHLRIDSGMSIKSSDEWTVPLCEKCHVSGNDAIHKIGSKNELLWFDERGVNALALAKSLWKNTPKFVGRVKDVEKIMKREARISKADRQAKKHLGLKKRKGRPLPGSKDSGWKRKLDGTWVRRD